MLNYEDPSGSSFKDFKFMNNSRGIKLIEEYKFDDASVKYASLSDKEAQNQINSVKTRIAEIQSATDLSDDPRKVMELKELKSSLFWLKQNKHRSKFFKIESSGPSMRRAKRHPESGTLKKRGNNAIRSCERKQKNRLSRKTVQLFRTVFPRAHGFSADKTVIS